MTLDEYLSERGESTAAFARRVGLVRETAQSIRNGATRCRIDIAQVIVRASRENPAPCGGTISYEDLIPEVTKASA